MYFIILFIIKIFNKIFMGNNISFNLKYSIVLINYGFKDKNRINI